MKYIRTYESFKSSNHDKLDEGILGKLFGKLKDKISLGFSKQFGSAKKVDKIMEEYKAEIMKAEVEKNKILKDYAAYLKSVKDGGEKDESKEKEISKTYDKAESNYVKQLEIIKQKFDIKFNDIMEDEENKKIKNFVTLKKLEMQQQLLKNELSIALTDTGLEEADIKDDEFFKKLTGSINKKMENNVKTQKEQTSELKKTETTEEGDKEEVKYKKGDKVEYKKEDGKTNEGEITEVKNDGCDIKVGDKIFYKKFDEIKGKVTEEEV
tara:strand:- start:41 stop:841 length:801 start_codon:yes stop_codon:yes gene_type:complete